MSKLTKFIKNIDIEEIVTKSAKAGAVIGAMAASGSIAYLANDQEFLDEKSQKSFQELNEEEGKRFDDHIEFISSLGVLRADFNPQSAKQEYIESISESQMAKATENETIPITDKAAAIAGAGIAGAAGGALAFAFASLGLSIGIGMLQNRISRKEMQELEEREKNKDIEGTKEEV